MKRAILLHFALFFCCFYSFSQVREIKKRSDSNKQRSSNSSDNSSSDASSGGFLEMLVSDIVFGIVKLPFQAAFHAQSQQSAKFQSDPWRLSFEVQVKSGIDFRQNTMLLNPEIRGNYGLFSSQLRYSKISDVSGGFGTLDWQILQMNFVNNEYARLTAGFGVSNEIGQNQSHPEGLIELSVFLMNREIVPTIVYRSSGDGYPRKEFSSMVSYRPFPLQDFTTQFLVGYTYQHWYDIPIHFISVGIGLIIQ